MAEMLRRALHVWGHAIISGNKYKHGCIPFFYFLKKYFPCLHGSKNTVISDRCNFLSAVQTVLGETCPFYCSRHRGDHIRGIYGTLLSQNFLYAFSAQNLNKQDQVEDQRISILHMETRNYINAVEDKHQYLIAHTKHGVRLYGMSTNRLSEAVNSANVRHVFAFSTCLMRSRYSWS